MKAFFRRVVWAALAVLVLCGTAFADMGPKPRLTVKLLHAPAEPYALDLLVPNDDASRYDNFSHLDPPPSPALVEAMKQAVPEGFHLALIDGTPAPMWGSLTGQPGDGGLRLHTFSYAGVPDTFGILLVTQSGKQRVIDHPLLHRTALQSSVTLDWETGRVTASPVALSYVLQFLSTLLPTLAIEGLLLCAFRFSWRANRRVFLLLNVATQLLLTATCGVSAITGGVSFFYYVYFFPVELLILGIEVLVCRRFLTGQSRRRAAVYAVTANVCSAGVGLALAAPIWRWLVAAVL